MALTVAFKSNSMMTVLPAEPQGKPVKHEKPRSLYTLQRDERFKKQGLKKFAARIAAIQVYFPGWQP